MASRACPKCNTQVPGVALAAFSNGIECPGCHTLLEVSPVARMLAAWLGLAAGYLAWRLTRGEPGLLGAALPLLYALLAFGIVSALGTILAGDLRIAPEPPPAAAPASAHGHGGGHH